MIVIVMGVVEKARGKRLSGACWPQNWGGNLPTRMIFIRLRMSKRFGTVLRSRMPTVHPGSSSAQSHRGLERRQNQCCAGLLSSKKM